VFVADDLGVEDARGGVQRVNGRVDAQLGDLAGQNRGGVQMGEGSGRGRVGQVVGRDVDGLDRGDGTLLGGGDALLQFTISVARVGW